MEFMHKASVFLIFCSGDVDEIIAYLKQWGLKL